MASGHVARTTPGSVVVTEASLMNPPHFQDGMAPWALEAALQREAPTAGRTWKVMDGLPAVARGTARTPEQVKAALEAALREGNGIAIVNTFKWGAGREYLHWVVVRKIEDGKVLIHDPEEVGHIFGSITSEGFGTYRWTGDTVVATTKGK